MIRAIVYVNGVVIRTLKGNEIKTVRVCRGSSSRGRLDIQFALYIIMDMFLFNCFLGLNFSPFVLSSL